MANPEIRHSKVEAEGKKVLKSGDYLVGTNGDQYITEASYIRVDDLTSEEIAYYDAIETDTFNEKKNLAYKLAKLKSESAPADYVTNNDIDAMFAECPSDEETNDNGTNQPPIG